MASHADRLHAYAWLVGKELAQHKNNLTPGLASHNCLENQGEKKLHVFIEYFKAFFKINLLHTIHTALPAVYDVWNTNRAKHASSTQV